MTHKITIMYFVLLYIIQNRLTSHIWLNINISLHYFEHLTISTFKLTFWFYNFLAKSIHENIRLTLTEPFSGNSLETLHFNAINIEFLFYSTS